MNTIYSKHPGLRIWLIAAALSMGAGCAAETAPFGDESFEDENFESNDSALGARPWKVLDVDYQVQETGYWCGPAATRVAISAHMWPPSQGTLASELGTTWNGTDWIGQITNVLNQRLDGSPYTTVEMPNDPPTQWQRDRFWNDIVRSIDNNYPVVANIVAPANNHPPGYPNYTIYHYFAIIGYNPQTRQVYIADSANFGGNKLYWLTFDQMASLVPPKGYAAYVCPQNMTGGAIDAKWRSLGTCDSALGGPRTTELPTADGVGRYNHFDRGSIYWHPDTGAHEVHGAIRDKWSALGWESGDLGYPITGERATADGVGRYNHFQHGSIYWTPETGAQAVMGAIHDKWADTGWESGILGYPTTDERTTPDGIGRYNHFEEGSIYWTPSTGAHAVHGAIHSKWSDLGWENSELGYPISDEYEVAGGRQSDFEGGSLRWDASTYQVSVVPLSGG